MLFTTGMVTIGIYAGNPGNDVVMEPLGFGYLQDPLHGLVAEGGDVVEVDQSTPCLGGGGSVNGIPGLVNCMMNSSIVSRDYLKRRQCVSQCLLEFVGLNAGDQFQVGVQETDPSLV